MHFVAQYGLFTLETLTLVIAVLCCVAGIIALNHKPNQMLRILSLDKQRNTITHQLYKSVTGKKAPKLKKDAKTRPSCFVLDFKGDVLASQVEALRQEISAILSIATPNDKVIVRLESPGGSVNGYGLAAAQLQRVRDHNIPMVACIDQVAASGGYLMACVANHITAAPFAIIGSIGVVATVPNLHRWLKKNLVDIELLTAGTYKRTLTLLGENTDSGRHKFQEDLEKIHTAFRNQVLSNRSGLCIEQVATGEHWLAVDALPLGLVDTLKTSDAVLDEHSEHYALYSVSLQTKQPLRAKLLKPFMMWLKNSLINTPYR